MANPVRLLCLIMVLLAALPAVQARACAPEVRHGEAIASHEGHGGHHGRQHVPPPAADLHHDCLGCIAPINVQAYRPTAMLRFAFDRDIPSGAAAFPAGRNTAPEPPPPRSFV